MEKYQKEDLIIGKWNKTISLMPLWYTCKKVDLSFTC